MRERRRSIFALGLLIYSLTPFYSAIGSETVNYTYDALGRLVQVSRSGTVNDGISASYSYDKADNRTNVTVVGSSLPSLTVSDVSATEGSALLFTVTRGGSTGSSVSVNYATSNGTATAGSDYTANSGTLTFASGEITKTVSVSTTDDAISESAETVNMTLSGATGGATISDPTGVGTINDNDGTSPPSFAINNALVTEGGNLVLTVTKTGSTSSSFSVNYTTANGTATVGSDYIAGSGTLTFAAADTTKTITIATINDIAIESSETVLINLSGATGAAIISNARGIGTINDNDGGTCSGVSYVVNDETVVEGSPLVFTVTKAGSTSSSCSVSYATANGTATTPTHYTAASGTLTFTSSQTSKTVTVQTIDNFRLNGTLNMYLNLSSPTVGATITDSQGKGSITASGAGGGGCLTC